MLFVSRSLLQPCTTFSRYFTFVHLLNMKNNIISKACSWREAWSGLQELHGVHPAFLQEKPDEPPHPPRLLCLACSQSSSQPGLFQDPLLPICTERCQFNHHQICCKILPGTLCLWLVGEQLWRPFLPEKKLKHEDLPSPI